jgi:nitrate/TMAO reductase-like tetraheme cytochrome c subunit
MTGNNFNPIWNKVDGTQAECGSCHGQWEWDESIQDSILTSIAPVGHRTDFEGLTCYNCHLLVVDQNDNIIDPTKHINGQIEFGD